MDSATNKIISKRYVVKQRPITVYAVDNGYYSDEGEEYYAESIQMELHVNFPDHEQWNGQKLIFVNDKPFSANLIRLQRAISRP